jgi:hypothetical protein
MAAGLKSRYRPPLGIKWILSLRGYESAAGSKTLCHDQTIYRPATAGFIHSLRLVTYVIVRSTYTDTLLAHVNEQGMSG